MLTVGKLAAAGVFVGLAACLAACRPAECDEEFCEDYLSFVLEKETPWQNGPYTVDFLFDGQAAHCAISIPYDLNEITEICDDGNISIGDSEGTSLSRMVYRSSPTQVRLILGFRGTVILDATFEPDYGDTPGWNEKCGPACEFARVTLELP